MVWSFPVRVFEATSILRADFYGRRKQRIPHVRNLHSMDTSSYDQKPDWRVIGELFPYLMEFRGRVVVAMLFLVAAKLATVAVPVALKYIIDSLDQGSGAEILIGIPLALVAVYGLLRFCSTFFGELRDAVFARVAERAMRRVSLKVFEHLHRLDLSFHLERRTGGLSRDIERGTNGISFLLRFCLFNVVPTILEIVMVAIILLLAFDASYMVAVVVAVVAYTAFSVKVTEWRTRFVRESHALDNRSNSRAVDSLLNYETVKYFGNERFESERFDRDLEDWENARLKNRLSLAMLNSGQAFIIGLTITVIMWMAVRQVGRGEMTLGDLTMINAYMIQLFIPLNMLGFVYREIRQALVNVERMFSLLKQKPAVVNREGAQRLQPQGGAIRFENVNFSYHGKRQILHDISFDLPAGHKMAIVGPSGSGKSTLARLLFRFYDVDSGSIRIDGQDIRDITQESLREAIGVVPQDTVLFNDTIYNNIAYGRPGAAEADVYNAARLAHLDHFIAQLPDGFNTMVGERGLKLSGGEKQRIAIARVLLKNPPILILDEATSSLDSHSEHAILSALNEISEQRTTLAIAHRLSTIQDAGTILVLSAGRLVEQGTHQQLLQLNGLYARLWSQQQQEEAIESISTARNERLPVD